MLSAILTMTILALAFGLLLGYSAVRFKVEGDPVADKIDALLPQTQCGQCSYAGCRPYAEAIANGEADINRCPPGGEVTMVALAELLGKDPKPLEDEEAAEKPKAVDASSRLPGSILSCSLHANRIFTTKNMRKINRNKLLHSRDLYQ